MSDHQGEAPDTSGRTEQGAEASEELQQTGFSLRENRIALAGATAGYIGFLAALLYPVSVIPLWLQLADRYASSYGDAWYAAWQVPTWAVVLNTLSVLVVSLVFGYLILYGAGLVVTASPESRPWVSWTKYLCYFLLLVPLLTIMVAALLFGFDSISGLLVLSLVTVVLSGAGSIGEIYIVEKMIPKFWRAANAYAARRGNPMRYLTPFAIVGVVLSLIPVMVAALLGAMYFVGLQNPDLPSIDFYDDNAGPYVLVTYHDDYWYVFDCQKNLWAYNKDETSWLNISTREPYDLCGVQPTPGWQKLLELGQLAQASL